MAPNWLGKNRSDDAPSRNRLSAKMDQVELRARVYVALWINMIILIILGA